MIQVKLEWEAPGMIGADCSEISLEQLRSILNLVWHKHNAKECRLNNITFYPGDSEVQVKQGYDCMQWVAGQYHTD